MNYENIRSKLNLLSIYRLIFYLIGNLNLDNY